MKQNSETEKNDPNQQADKPDLQSSEIIKQIQQWLDLDSLYGELIADFNQEELNKKISEFDLANSEFMDSYNKQILQSAVTLSIPLINSLDQADASFADEKINGNRRMEIYRDVTFKTMEIALELAKKSPGLDPTKKTQHFEHDPLEVSTVFVHLISKRLGDKTQLAPIGWSLFVNGLVGTEINVEEATASTQNYLKDF